MLRDEAAGHLSPLALHGPNALEKALGPETARKMWNLSVEAKQVVGDLIRDHNIDCDETQGFLYAAASEQSAVELREEVDRYKQDYQHESVEALSRAEVTELLGTDIYFGGLYDSSVIRVHPLRLAHGLASAAKESGVTIHENSEVLRYDPISGFVETLHGRVNAKNYVLASNVTTHLFESRIDKHVINVQSHICVTQPLGAARAQSLNRNNIGVMDTFPAPNYFHLTKDNRLFFGSEALIWEKDPEKIKAALRKSMLQVYPQLEDVQIEYGWTGRAALTPTFMPHLGKLEPNVYFSQVPGLTWSIMGGKLIAEDVLGQPGRFNVVAGLKNPAIPLGHVGRSLLGALMKSMLKIKKV